MQGDEYRHIVLAMLVTAIFFILFVFDAIIRENAFGLLASMILAICVAGRVVYYVVSIPRCLAPVCRVCALQAQRLGRYTSSR